MTPVTQYYGPEEVISQVESDGFVTLTLKNSESEAGESYELVVPTALFEMVVTKEKKDWNHPHNIKLQAASKEIMSVLAKYAITGGEIKQLSQKIALDYLTIIDRAINYQFTGNDKRFVPGGDVYYDFTLNRANEILKDLDGNTNTTTESAA
jgi:hypothetical protein